MDSEPSSPNIITQTCPHYPNNRKLIQQDWSNREYIEKVTFNIKKVTDFVNSFEISCKAKLANFDEKLTKLERQIEFVEAQIIKRRANN